VTRQKNVKLCDDSSGLHAHLIEEFHTVSVIKLSVVAVISGSSVAVHPSDENNQTKAKRRSHIVAASGGGDSIRPAEVSHHLSGCGDNGTVRELPHHQVREVVRGPREQKEVGQHLLSSMTVQRAILALR
jgi:hypothetical protein